MPRAPAAKRWDDMGINLNPFTWWNGATIGTWFGLRGMTLPKSSRGRRIAAGLARSPYKSGPAGIPAHLRSDYRNARRTGFSPPEAKKMLGLEA